MAIRVELKVIDEDDEVYHVMAHDKRENFDKVVTRLYLTINHALRAKSYKRYGIKDYMYPKAED